MGKAALYNDEKVLFFAEREEGLHVAKDEAKRVTDLHIIRQRLTGARMIKKVASDDSGNYYRTTTKGTKRLLELQIAWRTSNGKDVSEHRARLEEVSKQLEQEAGNRTTESSNKDWQSECEVCGASPIVPETGMCGPCTFGEAETAGGNW